MSIPIYIWCYNIIHSGFMDKEQTEYKIVFKTPIDAIRFITDIEKLGFTVRNGKIVKKSE